MINFSEKKPDLKQKVIAVGPHYLVVGVYDGQGVDRMDGLPRTPESVFTKWMDYQEWKSKVNEPVSQG